jgi:hypothetical protein
MYLKAWFLLASTQDEISGYFYNQDHYHCYCEQQEWLAIHKPSRIPEFFQQNNQ